MRLRFIGSLTLGVALLFAQSRGWMRSWTDTASAASCTTSAPSITSQPSSQIVRGGDTVTWSATADGCPTPTVQWQYTFNSGASWQDLGGITNDMYSFVAAVGDSARQFQAVFTNSAGTATTTPAGLTVTSDRPFLADFDGDGRADLAVWRPNNGTWYWLPSSSAYAYSSARSVQWGNQSLGDVPLLGDIDGDGKADLIVWRETTGTWYWLTSSSGYNAAMGGNLQWGNASLGDIPLVGDIDGDGKADLIVWRASTGTWYWLTSSTAYSYAASGQRQWGGESNGDNPLLGDFDGDGRADLTVWRASAHGSNGSFWWLTSSSGYAAQNQNADFAEPQPLSHFLNDVDGDGKADLIQWEASGQNPAAGGVFGWLTSSSNYVNHAGFQWGAQGDTPLVADLDGDGRPDFAVWRPSNGTWYWLTSSTGFNYSSAQSKQWGSATQGASAVR